MKHYCEMPAGTYYIGDLCYVMHEVWDEFCDVTIEGNECLQGKFKLKSGVEFVTFQTKYGDGLYRDQYRNRYSVDAGLIGCVNVKSIDKTNPDNQLDGGFVVEFPRDFVCFNDEGVLRFGSIIIDTANEEEECDY